VVAKRCAAPTIVAVKRTLPVLVCMFLATLLAGACGGGDTTWREAFDAEPIGWLYAAWGPSEDDVYVVGAQGEILEGVVMHYDGSEWEEIDLDLSIPLLQWVHGRSSTDVTFVGARGTIVHWDGSVATMQSGVTSEPLWGVWGATSDDLWAVGGSGFAEGAPVLLHYDGSEWTEVPIALDRPNVHAFFKVWGSAVDDVWVVGQRGALLHYDGSEWTELDSGVSEDLISVWGTGPDEVVMVGGRSNGVALLYDGTELSPIELPFGAEPLNGVWLRENTRAHAVGASGAHFEIDLASLDVRRVDEVPTLETLHGVFGVGNDLYAVGGNLFAGTPPFRGVALTRNIRE